MSTPSTSGTTQQGSLQGGGSGLSKNDSDCAGLAQHALVLGPGLSGSLDSFYASSVTRSGYTAVQWATSPRSQKPACLAPRASTIHETRVL